MKNTLLTFFRAFKDKEFIIAFLSAFLLLFGGLLINQFAGQYATLNASNPVTDIILDNVPVMDVDGIFAYGSILFWVFVTAVLIANPNHIPFVIKSVALFILVRALFVSVTHIGPFPDHPVFAPTDFMRRFTFGGDLFFSGHTGLPFLLALIYWTKSHFLRTIFFFTSLLFAFVVLAGHYHYSIDVFAAFFITYTIADMARFIFKKDHHRMYANT